MASVTANLIKGEHIGKDKVVGEPPKSIATGENFGNAETPGPGPEESILDDDLVAHFQRRIIRFAECLEVFSFSLVHLSLPGSSRASTKEEADLSDSGGRTRDGGDWYP
jgi:hypothetical protein